MSSSTPSRSTSARRSGLRAVVAGGALALVGGLVAPTLALASPVADPKDPNSAAEKAGVQRGNATMGWRDGVERATVDQATSGRVGALAKVTRAGKLVPMTGVLGIDVSSYQGVVDWVSFTKVKAELRLRQGDRGEQLSQPLLRLAVPRCEVRRHVRRRLPLRQPEREERQEAGHLLRQVRRRLDQGRQDPARCARHRVQPVRRQHVLRAVQEEDGRLDQGLPGHLQEADDPRRRHLHDHRLVEQVHREHHEVQHGPTRCGPPAGRRRRGRARCRAAGRTTRSGSTRRRARSTRTGSPTASPGSRCWPDARWQVTAGQMDRVRRYRVRCQRGSSRSPGADGRRLAELGVLVVGEQPGPDQEPNPVGASSEKPAPRPGTRSMVRCVCRQ